MKCKIKTIFLEANQWFKNGDHPRDYDCTICRYTPSQTKLGDAFCADTTNCILKANEYEGNVVGFYRTPSLDGASICPDCGNTMHNHGYVGNNLKIVCPGDFIITNEYCVVDVCSPNEFNKKYEIIKETK